MMKKRYEFMAFTLAMLLTMAMPVATYANMQATYADGTYVHGGAFTDWNSLTWTANDKTVTTYGRGPVFGDVHPEITDPEYYLKAAVYYPGEDRYSGAAKANNPDEVVEELRSFVNSFDWIHSDELTRATMVHDRIANGCHGNVYAYPEGDSGFSLLMNGKGQCGNFSGEFQRLANYVGLECEVYTPSEMHQACLIKISGQWFATDPTSDLPFLSNSNTHPVDYETEIARYGKESKGKWNEYFKENPNSSLEKQFEMMDRLANGEITVDEYNAMWDSGELN